MTSRRKRLSILLGIGALLLALLAAGAIYERRPQFFPYVVLQSGEPLQVRFLQHAVPERKQCDARVKMVSQALLGQCTVCRIVEARCLEKLDPIQRKFLHGQPVDVPTMRVPEGAIAFFAATPELALQACRESANQTQRRVPDRRECSTAGFESFQLSVSNAGGAAAAGGIPGLPTLIAITLIAAVAAFLAGLLIVRTDRWHAWFSHDQVEGGPQKFHAKSTPRIGGLALVAGLAASIFAMNVFGWLRATAVDGLTLLAMAAIPAFAGGIGEDVTKRVGVFARLMLTISAGVIASLLVGATLDRVDVPGLDTLLLRWPIFAIAFTAFAVGGVANAVNIIDGYNGLVGGYAILVLAALSFVSMQVGDPVVLAASLMMAGALVGFLVWNYPNGRIFLGDGGAYLLGFWLAELSVLLVTRNPEVSPWFPMVLLAYPVFETLFSIYRRKLVRGKSAGHPDALHLHQLIYLRLARVSVGSRDPRDITQRNSAVAKYVLAGTVPFILATLFSWRNTQALIALALIFCGAYVWLYLRLVRWRAPAWLISSPKRAEWQLHNHR